MRFKSLAVPKEIAHTRPAAAITPPPTNISSSAKDPFTLPRARATGWRGWAARVLGTKIVRETEQERVTAYSWRGTLYVAGWFPPDANFYHD